MAWDVEREDWRTFRLDRMEPRIPTGPRFQPREVPEVDRTMRGVANGGYRYRARFLLQAPAEQIADRIPSTVGVVEMVDSSTCVLSAGSNSLDELLLYVGLLGVDFVIQSPPELIAHVQTLTTRLARAIP